MVGRRHVLLIALPAAASDGERRLTDRTDETVPMTAEQYDQAVSAFATLTVEWATSGRRPDSRRRWCRSTSRPCTSRPIDGALAGEVQIGAVHLTELLTREREMGSP